jgi:hypothetical protein
LNTLQKVGVHGLLSNALQNSWKNGVALICRRRGSALTAVVTRVKSRMRMARRMR